MKFMEYFGVTSSRAIALLGGAKELYNYIDALVVSLGPDPAT
jgi:hypothetical protein